MTRRQVSARRAERRVVVAFASSAVAAAALAIVYWRGGQPQLEGLLLGVSLGALAFGFVTWANHLLTEGPVTGDRHPLPSPPAVEAAAEDAFERDGELTRRRAIVRSLAIAAGALGAAALFPLRSLGPRPGRSLSETPWRRGLRLVTEDGRIVRAADVPLGGLVTVFPEGHTGAADAQAVLVRVDPQLIEARPGREQWSPDGLLAYSKICTHAGCPVGLYEAQDHQLLCPCHQSTFDVLRHARPVFGPAAAPLPQLPLRIDRAGNIVAQGDFSDPVGPAFWTSG
jgi:ubiquinol-cytochrome c reductase iron-sulfur subunit